MTRTGRVVVLARAPQPGTVKTRLHPLLGPECCAALQAVLLRGAVTTAQTAAPGRVSLAVDPPDACDMVASSLPWKADDVFGQSSGHLGQRMADAVGRLLAAGHRELVVIGTDVPLLRPEHLSAAFGRLAAGCDVVFGPALDGGYTLLAMRGDQRGVFDIDPAAWGGPEVLRASLARAEALGLRVDAIDPLRDLDTPDDALALLTDPSLPADVRAILAPAVGAPAGGAP